MKQLTNGDFLRIEEQSCHIVVRTLLTEECLYANSYLGVVACNGGKKKKRSGEQSCHVVVRAFLTEECLHTHSFLGVVACDGGKR